MKQPKISVIVPVYKVELYLRSCLDSIVNQTYQNLEIILVDDGSPDNCGAICDEYAAKDHRIVVIHQENAGVSAARNAGLDRASGHWLSFVDSDDWLEPDMYAYLLQLAQDYDADIVQCGLYMDEDDTSEELFAGWEQPVLLAPKEFGSRQWQMFSHSASNKLYRASAAAGVLFPVDCSWGEDLVYNVAVMVQAKRICLGTKFAYHYVQRAGSACHQQMDMKFLKNRQISLDRAGEIMKQYPGSRRRFLQLHMESVLDCCSKLVLAGKPEPADQKRYLRHCVRKKLPAVWGLGLLSCKDRLKSVLVAWAWWLYRALLLASKKN